MDITSGFHASPVLVLARAESADVDARVGRLNTPFYRRELARALRASVRPEAEIVHFRAR